MVIASMAVQCIVKTMVGAVIEVDGKAAAGRVKTLDKILLAETYLPANELLLPGDVHSG